MADLDLLDPPPLLVSAGGESFLVRPIKLRHLPAVVRALSGLHITHDFDLVALMRDHGERVLAAASIAADIPLERLARFGASEALDLVTAVLECNAAMFEPLPEDAEGKRLEWVDAIQRLVSAGHHYSDVLDYPVPLCRRFLAAINDAERALARADLMVARAAQATKEGFDAVLRSLDDA